MINYNPMSKEFQDEAKKLNMSGFRYMQLLRQKPLRQKSCGTNDILTIPIRTSNISYPKSPGQIKSMLISKYYGRKLEDVISGTVINTEKGDCYSIESREIARSINGVDEKSLFIDIETLGFYSVPIILIGIARVSDNNITVNQYLSRNAGEEPAMLTAFLDHFRKSDNIITFNGRRFDAPFIDDRLSYHKIKESVTSKAHYDALYPSRSAWKTKLPNCKLGTLEKHILGIEREDDVPSRSVPDFYRTYVRQNNVGPLVPIIDHNKQDLITLAKIYCRLKEE